AVRARRPGVQLDPLRLDRLEALRVGILATLRDGLVAAVPGPHACTMEWVSATWGWRARYASIHTSVSERFEGAPSSPDPTTSVEIARAYERVRLAGPARPRPPRPVPAVLARGRRPRARRRPRSLARHAQ